MNLNLIKCSLGFHTYEETIKNETLNMLETHCKYCNHTKFANVQDHELDKLEIINDLELGKIAHARQKINTLFKKLGY